MNVSFKSKVILDDSINTFPQEVKCFVINKAKPALEQNFDSDIKFFVSREITPGIILGGRQIKGWWGKELFIEAYRKGLTGFVKHCFNPIKILTHFEKRIDREKIKTLEGLIKELKNPDRLKYTAEEVLLTAKKAINKLLA